MFQISADSSVIRSTHSIVAPHTHRLLPLSILSTPTQNTYILLSLPLHYILELIQR